MSSINEYPEYTMLKRKFDPIWGSIPITNGELAIIESPYFSRLNFIKQMGIAQISYPGAVHNRYMHSIGVMHVAGTIAKMVKFGKFNNGKFTDIDELPRKMFYKKTKIPCINIFRIAALLHDIGHPPLSHLLEEFFRKYDNFILLNTNYIKDHQLDPTIKEFISSLTKNAENKYSHENATTYLIEHKMADLILDALKAHDEDHNLTKSGKDRLIYDVSQLAKGEVKEDSLRLFNKLINGDIDADKLDYIVRDCYFSGLPIKISLEEFEDKLFICENSGDFFITPEGLTTINSFLYARYKLIKNIHLDKTHRIASQQVIQLIKEAFTNALTDQNKGYKFIYDQIYKMHIDHYYQDNDLDDLVEECHPKGIQISDIRRKSGIYDEIFRLEFNKLDPITKISLQNIVDHPSMISLLQDKVREELGFSEELLLDVRNAKPSNFQINVFDNATNCPPVYSYSQTALGILDDSIEELTLYLYHNKEQYDDVSINKDTIRNLIREVGLCASKMSCENKQNAHIRINLLIVLMAIVILETSKAFNEELHESVKQRDIWFYSITTFHNFMINVFKENDVPTYSNENLTSVLDSNYFKDMEFLRLCNLIQMRKTMVGIPITNDDEIGTTKEEEIRQDYFYNNRENFRITDFGFDYFKLLLNNIKCIYELFEHIKENVKIKQRENIKDIWNYASSDAEYQTLRSSSTKEDDTDKSRQNELHDVRSAVRKRSINGKDFCLLIFD